LLPLLLLLLQQCEQLFCEQLLWRAGHEYLYTWRSQQLTGIPQMSGQYAGFRSKQAAICHASKFI
jgi:hypothetical protein